MSESRVMPRARHVVIVLIALGVIVVGWFATRPGPMDFVGTPGVALSQYDGQPTGTPADLANQDEPLVRGRYLTQAADCEACHTSKGGRPFAGGVAFKTQFGTLYSPNITPDAQTGIGNWTDAQFLKAMHEGIRPDGARLYPAFPYASYTYLTEEDVLSIKAYLATIAPVKQLPPPNELSFPFNQRFLMTFWSAFFNPSERFRPQPDQSPEWNRGAYLVEGLAHCGECHTPRNLLQGLDNQRKFAGAVVQGWRAYNITTNQPAGIGDWSDDQLAAYLSTGHARNRGSAAGPMLEAVELSLRHLSSSDIDAMIVYMRSVPALTSPDLPAVLAEAAPSAHDGGATRHLDGRGKEIFESACASCHTWSGAGALTSFATLTGARSVNDATATNVVQIILQGAAPRSTDPNVFMPAFANAYSDVEIAAVANYVTARFGAHRSSISASAVADLRDGG